VLEHSLHKRIFGLKGQEVTEFVSLLLTRYYVHQIKEYVIDRAYSMHWRDEECKS